MADKKRAARKNAAKAIGKKKTAKSAANKRTAKTDAHQKAAKKAAKKKIAVKRTTRQKAAKRTPKQSAARKPARKKTARKIAKEAVQKRTGKSAKVKRTERAPKALKPNEKRILKDIFESTQKHVQEEDVQYALNRTGKKLKGVPPRGYLRAFIKQIELLYKVLRDSMKRDYKLPWKVIAAITAALLYFISPIDLIPDVIPVVGFVDDAVVVTFCLSMIREELLDYCYDKNMDPEEYGL